MAGNEALNKASKAKKDEFYTQLADIEVELKHYKKHFKSKTVFCNCDDPYESNFFKYFAMNFNYLGLKKLIATCYNNSPVSGEQLSIFDMFPTEEEQKKYAYKIEKRGSSVKREQTRKWSPSFISPHALTRNRIWFFDLLRS